MATECRHFMVCCRTAHLPYPTAPRFSQLRFFPLFSVIQLIDSLIRLWLIFFVGGACPGRGAAVESARSDLPKVRQGEFG